MNTALDNIRAGIEYSIRRYENVSPERAAQIADERAAREERIAHARPRLDVALRAYREIARTKGLVGRIAHMHKPSRLSEASRQAGCAECDPDDYWPCDTATAIAKEHDIDFMDMDLYRWDIQ